MASCNIIGSSINDLLEKENSQVVKAPYDSFYLLHRVLIALKHEIIDFKVILNKLKQQLRQELIANKTSIKTFTMVISLMILINVCVQDSTIHRFVI